MSTDSVELRTFLHNELQLLTDPRFEHAGIPAAQLDEMQTSAMASLATLREEKREFFDRFDYRWAFDSAAYSSPFEALLQWRLLNVVTDIPPDHPDLARCEHMVVRVLPHSCARIHMRRIGDYKVIVLTHGYLSAFKGFARLWIRGRALGRARSSVPANRYRESSMEYVAGVKLQEAAVIKSAKAYLGTLIQLLENEPAIMDHESLFDEKVVKREEFWIEFGRMSHAIDGFLLFHEVAHCLSDDSEHNPRSLQIELQADVGSVSLCIIDEARRGGTGTVHLGAPMFFCVELLRLLVEEILEIGKQRHDPSKGRYPGMEELMMRSQLYEKHVDRFLGRRVLSLFHEWQAAISPVFDTVRWTLLNSISEKPATTLSLHEFITQTPRTRNETG